MGTLLYANGEVKYDSSFVPASGPTNGFDTFLWEAKLEHRFAFAPVAGFVKYRGSRTEFDPIVFGVQSDELKVTDHRVFVGLKLFLGPDTLRANDAALSEAIKAHTTAVNEPAPVPVEPQVQPES